MEDVQALPAALPADHPNFEPSADAYAVAMQVYEQMRDRFAAAGLGGPTHSTYGPRW